MKILRHLLSPLLASGLSRNSCCDGITIGVNRGVLQNRLIAIIRCTAVVWGSLSLLSGSLALAQTTQSVSLAWNADTDASVVGYNVHYGTSGSSLTKTQNVGAASTATVSGLTTGQTYYFAVTAYNAAGVNSAYSNEVSYTPTATPTSTPAPTPTPTPTPTSSLFSASDAPSNVQQTWNDGTPVELGVKFQTSVAGTVTGIRFYKASGNTGTHVGNLWSATGALLATANFTNETASGWQQVNLSKPVTLTAGTTYVVSYHTTIYSCDQKYFTNGLTRGPLTAPASSASGGNGVYAYGSSSNFPASSYNSSNYWVDVAFLKTGSQPPALAINAKAYRDQGTASATVVTPSFSTVSKNELFLAFVATDYLSGANTTVTNVTGAGLSWTLVKRTNTQAGTAEIWRAFATAPLSQVNVTATLSQSVASSITVMTFTGVDTSGTNGSGAIGATGTANSTRGAPTASLTTTRNGSWVVGVGNDYDNAISRSAGTNQTIVHQDLAPAGDTFWVQMQNTPTPWSGTAVTINDTAPTADRYNLSICEVLPAP